MKEYYRQLVGALIVDFKIVDDTPILIIQKTNRAGEIFYYEVSIKSLDGQSPGLVTGLPWMGHEYA